MPFKSKAQRRKFYAMAARGEISRDKVREWERETKGKKLPERVSKKEAWFKFADDDEEKKGRTPTAGDKVKIKAFVRSHPNLTDDKFHDYCEQLGVNVHKAEEVVYAMARALSGGKAEDEGKSPKSMSKREMAMGKKVEMEHTRDPKAAKEISSDHLAEIPDYYTRLHKMESEAKMKKSAAFEAGVKTANENVYYGLQLREDSRLRMMKELSAIQDPGERERYMADMSARNHRLTMDHPETKIASFDVGVAEALAKVAKKKKDDDSGYRKAMGAVGSVVGGQLLHETAGAPINKALLRGIRTKQTPSLSPAEVETLKRHLKVPHARVSEARKWESSMALGGHRGTAMAPKHSPELLAHELGHLSLRRNPALGGALTAGRVLGGVGGTAVGGAMAAGGERGSKTVRLAPAVAAAGHAPRLLDEGLASIKGYRALKKTKKMTPAQLKAARRNLARAFGTYGAHSLAGILPVAAISAARWKKDNKK